ncbi:hypothetical protein A0H81_07922 [Grifola frondosa]|uniref:F-box domain-containing protein n=1 Tax=Grifola frondosa TaxID=5627 RepID=A0A1C7M5R0_GRIFR|nr:hypothetical protein A0H81_07922 [Grifola frondosa]
MNSRFLLDSQLLSPSYAYNIAPAAFLDQCEARTDAKLQPFRKRLVDFMRDFRPRNESPLNGDYNFCAKFRVADIFDTIYGFHTGSLDMDGRREERYRFATYRLDIVRRYFDMVLAHSTKLEQPQSDGGRKRGWVQYKVSPSSALEIFKQRCNLGVYDIVWLNGFFEDLTQYQTAHPEPQFQRVFLLHLPTELLRYILDLSTPEGARVLGATCHTLHEIAVDYIYRSRLLVLTANLGTPDEDGNVPMHNDELPGYLRRQAHTMQRRFVEDAAFLLTSPRILNRMQKLCIHSRWDEGYRTLPGPVDWLKVAGLEPESSARTVFFCRILRGIELILAHSRALLELRLFSIPLTPTMITFIGAQNTIHTLELCSCRFTVPEEPYHQPLDMMSVMNASLTVREQDSEGLPNVFTFLPNLRTLMLSGREDFSLLVPDEHVREVSNPFRTLERVYFRYFEPSVVDELSEWIRSSATKFGGLHLTHFKMHTATGMLREDVESLIDALHGTPLQTLVLEGVSYVGPDLFQRIAEAFPRLNALTVINRTNRQSKLRSNIWPHPAWEYAQQFAGFQCLKYFGWNFSLEPRYVGTTFDLQYFEDGYPNEQNGEDEDWELCFEDWTCVASVFLAYCKTLRTLAFLDPSVAATRFDVSKDEDGKHVIREIQPGYRMVGPRPYEVDEFNPDDRSFHLWQV